MAAIAAVLAGVLDTAPRAAAALSIGLVAVLALAGAPTVFAAGGPLVGTFDITPGANGGGGEVGSYFRMIEPGGNATSGPFLSNANSSATDKTYTLLSPGTDGGLITGAYEPEPSPAFDEKGNSLASLLIQPTSFFGVNFSDDTAATDPQTKEAVPAPSISTDGSGNLSGNLSAWGASWNNQEFNQGSPKPNGESPGLTAGPTGTYNAVTGAYTLNWTSLIVGGPFNNFTGEWHLTGTFVPKTPSTGAEAYENGKLLTTSHIPVTGFGTIQLLSEVIGEVTCTNTFYGEAWNQVVGSETKGVGEIAGWGATNCTAPTYISALETSDKSQIERKEVACRGGFPGTKIGEGKCFTVFATAEEPLETEKEEAEVCKVEGKKLSECPGAGEKQVVKLTSAIRRHIASLPWKAELERTTREGSKVIAQRIGVHAFGEAGANEDAQKEAGACYPKQGGQSANWKAVPSGCVLVNVVFPQIPDEIVFYGSQEAEDVNGSKNGLFPSVLKFEELSGKLFSSEDTAGELNEAVGEVKTIGTNAVELLTTK